MFRNKLFVKIYLWFWVATILMIVTAMTVDWITESDRWFIQNRRVMMDFLPTSGLAAITTFEKFGPSALADYAGHLERSAGLKTFLYDGHTQMIPGRVETADLAKIVKHAAASDKVEFVSLPKYDLAAYRITAATGKTYIFAAQLPHKSVSSLPPPLPPLVRFEGGPARHGPPPPPGASHRGPPPFSWMKLLIHLLLSGIVCYWLARYVTRPIVTLRDATRRIAAGDLSVRVTGAIGARNDEISGLAHDFDRMTGRVEGLLNSQKALLRDISHELRSPLARLNVALELCRRKLGLDAEAPLARIERESEKLNELIGQLLTLNVLESGLPGPADAVVNLGHLIHEIAADAAFEAENENKSVSVNAGDGSLVRGNRELLRRAVENIVRNAVRYTKEESAVEITLRATRREDHPYALITVRDHGSGVPEESLPNLFQPFYRVAEDRDRRTGGMGLGMAITEAAVRIHHGDVHAKNAPDGGLIIEMTLPLIRSVS